jgi:hypothetical protein
MKIRLVGGAIAGVIALGALLVPSPAPVEAASSSCTGWASSLVPPTSIRVLRTATKRTQVVDFRLYVNTVMPAEWGASHPAAALQAGAVAVKQYAWYYALVGHWRGGKDATGRCYDLRDDSIDQVYDPAKKPASSHLAAIEATWSWTVRRSDALILTGYRPGIARCGDNATGYRLYQLEASRCASVNRWTAQQILRAYYSPAGKPASVAIPGENDMTGDDRGDAAAVRTSPDGGETTVRLFTGDPGLDPADVADAAGVVLATVPAGSLLGRAAADVDGDGRRDLLQLVARPDDTVAVEVMTAGGAGFSEATTRWASSAGQFAPAEITLVAGDFTGDGKGDAGILQRTSTLTKLWLLGSTGTGFQWRDWRLSVARDLTAAAVVSGDFTGDGRDDLAFLVPDGPPEAPTTTVIEVAAAGRVSAGVVGLYFSAPVPWVTELAPPSTIKAVAGDFDRTGRDDLLLLRRVSTDTVRVLAAQSTGTAFTRRWVFTDTENPIPWSKTKAVATDVWKDARTDLVLFLDLGTDEGGASLGTRLLRLRSYATYLTAPSTWFTDPALDWTTVDPY